MGIVFGKERRPFGRAKASLAFQKLACVAAMPRRARECSLPCCNPEAVDTIIVRSSIDPTSVSAFQRG